MSSTSNQRRRPEAKREIDDPILAALTRSTPLPQLLVEPVSALDLRVLWCNEAATIRGLAVSQSRGARSRYRLLPALSESLWEGYRETLALGGPHSYEEFLSIEEGESWWLTSLEPLELDGRPCLLATFQDVSFARPTEVALRTVESTFRELSEVHPDGVAVCRADGALLYANPNALHMLGEVTPEQGLRSFIEYAAERARDSLATRLAEVARCGAPVPPMELAFTHADGERAVELRMAPLLLAGAPTIMLLMRDLTELRNAQASLARADSLMALGRMAAGVAHEINNPLGYLIANLDYANGELVALGKEPNADVERLQELRAALSDALEGAQRVAQIVKDLRGLARADHTPPTPCDVVAAIESAVTLARLALERSARLVRRYDQVPRVLAVEARLVQVFLNLLRNAADAVDGGSVMRSSQATERDDVISLRVSSDSPDWVLVEIEDTGCGFDEGVHARLFDPFYTTKPSSGGMGMGLTVCQQLIHAVGGTIEASSVPGKGAVFRVRLRAARETGEEA